MAYYLFGYRWNVYNTERSVYYDATRPRGQQITYTDAKIEQERPRVTPSGPPDDGYLYAPGAVVLPQFCEGAEGVTIHAQNAAPHAYATVDANAAACAVSESDLDVGFLVERNKVTFTFTTSRPPVRYAPDNVLYNSGVSSPFVRENLANGTYSAWFKDASNLAVEKVYSINVSGPTEPDPRPGSRIHSFSTADGGSYDVYYEAPLASSARKITSYYNGGGAVNKPVVTAEELGYAAGDEYTWFCEDGTKVQLLASLSKPFATIVTEANSVSCGAVVVLPLEIESLTPTGATVAGGTGSVAAVLSGGTLPFVAQLEELGVSVEVGQLAHTMANVPPGRYTYRVTDSGQPAQTAFQEVKVAGFVEAVPGCGDEEALNYNPLATVVDNSLCQFAPRWRSAWPRVEVPVQAQGDPLPAYLTAQVYAGFPEGHPLAAVRPLVFVAQVRAVVAPRTAVALFDIGPYVRPLLGAAQGDGTSRLDINSPTAGTLDLFTGYQLRLDGKLQESGLVVNSALPDAALTALAAAELPLLPFGGRVPVWPGFSFDVTRPATDDTGRYGLLEFSEPAEGEIIRMACPRNPVPVCWLTPAGGFGYWVFGGKPEVGDDIGEAQIYTEAVSGERRKSQAGEAFTLISAHSGVFSQRYLVDGLRTLRRSVQAWYQPDVESGEWKAILLQGGTFPAYRMGRSRYEATIQFTEAKAADIQGQ